MSLAPVGSPRRALSKGPHREPHEQLVPPANLQIKMVLMKGALNGAFKGTFKGKCSIFAKCSIFGKCSSEIFGKCSIFTK